MTIRPNKDTCSKLLYISAIMTTRPDKTPVPYCEDDNDKEVLHKVKFLISFLLESSV